MSGATGLAPLFDGLYGKTDDPWGFRTRWYERRKRQIALASLPCERFERVWELGCSNGELSAELAPRCAALLATDGHARAAEAAARRLENFRHARVQQQWHPAEWPTGVFDLIVVSELGYYFAPQQMPEFTEKLTRSLGPDGVLLACHWRHPIAECAWTGDDVHHFLEMQLGWPELMAHREADFVMQIWSRDGRSVATREDLR